MNAVRTMLMRGGTSKGLYFVAGDLPTDPSERDALLLDLMGSPDPRQIDGLGGAHPLTSKVAIVRPSDRPGVDVDYLFLQVGVDEGVVSDRQNCGNLLAGVAPFAIERGLIQAAGDRASVRIHMDNTGATATAAVPLDAGQPVYAGETSISGVPGTAAEISIELTDIAGSSTGAMLPTENVVDRIGDIDVTLIDNGMPLVVLEAAALGVVGDEPCDVLEADEELRHRLEAIRLAAGQLMNLGDVSSATVPKLTLVSPPRGVGHLATRTFIPHRCHQAIGVLGAVSVATAARLGGSTAAAVAAGIQGPTVILEHPSGTMQTSIEISNGEVSRSVVVRTARKLMDGMAFRRLST